MKENLTVACFLGVLFLISIPAWGYSTNAFWIEKATNLSFSPASQETNSTSAYSDRGIANFTITPTEPYSIKKLNDILDGTPFDMSARNGILAVASGEGGIQILNITNPAKIELISIIERSNPAYNTRDLYYQSVFLYANYLYAGNNHYFEIYDISDPSNPRLVYFKNIPAMQILVNNSVAYLRLERKILLINVSNPHSPSTLSTYYDENLRISIMELHNNLLFLGGYPGYVKTLNVSDPTRISLISYLNFGGDITLQSMAYQESAKFLHIGTNGYESVIMIDFADPLNPSKIGGYRDIPYDNSTITIYDPKGLIIEGDIAFIANIGTVFTVNISDPIAPVGIYAFQSPLTQYTTQIIRYSSFIFALDSYAFTYSINASNIYNQTLAGNFSSITLIVKDVAVRNGIAYTITDQGFMSINVTTPSSMRILDSYRPPVGEYSKIVLQNNMAFLIRTAWGISVFDITNPSNLSLVSTILTNDPYTDLDVNGTLLAALHPNRVNLVNITDIYNPTLLTSITLSNASFMVEIQQNYMFIRDDLGMTIFDISDPHSPYQIKKIISDFPNSTPYFLLSKQYAVLACDNTLVIYNTTVPENTYELATVSLFSTISTFALYNQTLIVQDFGYLHIVNITDPSSPVIEQTIDYWKTTATMDFSSEQLVIGSTDGLEIFSFSTSPSEQTIFLEYSVYLSPFPASPRDSLSFGLWVNNTSWITSVYVLINFASGLQTIYFITFDASGFFNITMSFPNDPPLSFGFQIHSKSMQELVLDNGGKWYSTNMTDYKPPELTSINYPKKVLPGETITISVTLQDPSGIQTAFLNYYIRGKGWNQLEMEKDSETETSATCRVSIRDDYPPGSTLLFYLEAVDTQYNKAKFYDKEDFYKIEIIDPNPSTESQTDPFPSSVAPPELPLSFPWVSSLLPVFALAFYSRTVARRKK